MRSVCAIAILLLCTKLTLAQITRGDTTVGQIALVFTGDEFADGGDFIRTTLSKKNIKASFFLTGNFLRNQDHKTLIQQLVQDKHYLGSHSDRHLLYCDWVKRDSLLVTKEIFNDDLDRSYVELAKFGVERNEARFFLPPFEWYNDSIVKWTNEKSFELVNFTPGTKSTSDYTYPQMGERYKSAKEIYQSIIKYEASTKSGLNGFILLVHIGTDPRRTDKFYYLLPSLIDKMKAKGYQWVRIDELLQKFKNR